MNLIRYTLTTYLLILCLIVPSSGQIVTEGDTLYANEWIDYNQVYVKIRIAADGIYRITADQLTAAGVPLSEIDASDLRLFWLGKERKLFVTKQSGTITEDDYIEFFGYKNRSQVDRFLFSDPDQQMLNPDYGLTSDTSTYFLTWIDHGAGARYDVISNNPDGNAPLKKEWYVHHKKIALSSAHHKGRINSEGVRYSTYGEGEGFSSGENTSHSFDFELSHMASIGPEPVLRIRMTGNTQLHQVNWKWNGQPIADFSFLGTNLSGGSELIDTSISLLSEVKLSNTFMSTTSGGSDKVRFGVLDLAYPRLFRFNQQSSILINVEEAREGIYLELEDFNHASIPPRVYDLSGGTVSEGTIENGLVKIYLPSGPNNRQLAIVHPDSVLTTNSISTTSFTNLSESNAEFIIISHSDLYDDGQGKDWVKEYANYRSSEIGGGYQTAIVNIDQLVDQFAYGVDMHPLSVKNFSNFIYKNWRDPQFLFLIGKGLEYSVARTVAESYEYLPVYGIPGSDNILASRGESSVPLIPVGRLAARSAEHIMIYLDKIKVMEDQIINAPQTIEDRGWMKRVLHLGGGIGQSEVEVLRRKLQEMGEILEESELQADVFAWSIQSQDVIDFNDNETVIDLINDGLIIKTYFGHGSVFTTQFNGFEDPQFLNNKDRYSVMLSLGCHTGNLFIQDISLGESNIFAVDKGAVLYMATSGLGFISALDSFGKDWYKQVGGDQLNSGVGQINQQVIASSDGDVRVGVKTLLQQLIVHGDPAFKLSRWIGPDYTIDQQSVKFEPPIISSIQDSFALSLDLYNLGSRHNDSVQLDFFHELPSKKKVPLSTIKVRPEIFKQSITVLLPLLNEFDLKGINTLHIEINQDRSIIERPDPSAYQNNSLVGVSGISGIKIPIVNNGVSQIFPPDNGILTTPNLELISSTADPLAVSEKYIIQIDTTQLFNSNLMIQTSLNQTGGLITWSPPIDVIPSQVYYWRISPDSSKEQSHLWVDRSFTYIPDSPNGWCQSHFFQFLDGQGSGLDILETRKFGFKKSFNEIRILNVRQDSTRFLEFFYDGQQFGSPLGSPLKAGINIIVVNPVDQQWFINDGAAHGSVLIPGELNLYAYDVSIPEARQSMIKFIDEVVPEGHYVFMYTHLKDTVTSFHPELWALDSITYSDNLFSALERHGATKIRGMAKLGTVPYNFFFQKNGPVLAEDIAASKTESILSSGKAFYLNSKGSYRSTPIGPASAWRTLNWDFSFSENPEDDQFKLSLYGIPTPESEPQLIRENIPLSGLDISHISALEYPQLSLEVNASDMTNRSSANLENWKVLYEGVGDATFNPLEEYQFRSDTVNLGDNIHLIFAVANVTNFNLDSLLISYTLTTPENNDKISFNRYQPLKAKSSYLINHEIKTNDLGSGAHLLTVNLNPNADQPEAFLGNNILLQKFFLAGDRIKSCFGCNIRWDTHYER